MTKKPLSIEQELRSMRSICEKGCEGRCKHCPDDLMRDAATEIETLRIALSESVKLQSHYADILNMEDSGRRIIFADANAWVERLRTIGVIKKTSHS